MVSTVVNPPQPLPSLPPTATKIHKHKYTHIHRHRKLSTCSFMGQKKKTHTHVFRRIQTNMKKLSTSMRHKI